MERRNEYRRTYCAFLKQARRKFHLFQLYHSPYGKYLTLKYQRKAAQQGQYAKERIKTDEYVSLDNKKFSGTTSLMEFTARQCSDIRSASQ